MSRGRNGAAGAAKGARRATVADPSAVLGGKDRWSARRKMTVVLKLLRGAVLAAGRLRFRRANALPCNRPLEYGGFYLSKKSGAVQVEHHVSQQNVIPHYEYCKRLSWLRHTVRSTWFWIITWVVLVVTVASVLSIIYWDWLSIRESNGSTIRNIILAAAAVIALPLAVWRSRVAERQADAAQRQSETAQRGLLNERYQKGAEMLGSAVLSVRLGGIVALERLAEDHPAEFRHVAFKLLIEFVRTPPALQQAQPKVWDGWLQLERPATRQDVQAAVKVIARLEQLPRIGDATGLQFLLDLRGAQLCGVDLRGLRLSRATLENANLMFATLENMDLTGAQLQWANCRQTRFERADLSGAHMSDADFSGVRARGCKFRGAMMPATMVDADLEKADLTEATFPNTDLTGAKFRAANLTGADLRGWIYWIDWGGRHEAEHNAVRITQEQLDEAVADPDRPPNLSVHAAGDTKPGKRLVWQGKAPSKNAIG